MNFENEFRNRFKEKESLEAIDADQLWQAVSDELTEPKPIIPFFRSFAFKLSIIVILFILMSVLYFLNTNHSVTKIEKPTATLLEKESTIKTEAIPPVQSKEIQPSIISNHQTDTDSSDKNLGVEESTQDPLNKYSNSTPLKSRDLASTHRGMPESKSLLSIAKNEDKKRIAPSPSQSIQATTSKPITGMAQLPKIELEQLPIEPNPVASSFLQHPIKVQHTTAYFLSFHTGINKVFFDYKNQGTNSDIKTALEDANQAQIGSTAGFRLTRRTNGKITLGTGLDYEVYREKFSTVLEQETELFKENYLKDFDMDPITGDTINQVYEDVWLDALSKRTVVYHNTFHLLSLPLELGYHHQKGKLGLGINIGLSANLLFAQKGKTFDRTGGISQIAEDKLFNQFFVAYHLQPYVEYSLSKKVSLRLSPTVKWQNFGNSELYGLQARGTFTGLTSGLTIGL